MPVSPDRAASGGPSSRLTNPSGPLQLLSEFVAVRRALSSLTTELANLPLTQEDLSSVELVIAEVLNNIVEHAYGGNADGQIALSWTFGATGLLFRVEDKGNPMPDCKLPPPYCFSRLRNRTRPPENGFGWLLIQRLAYNVVYRRHGSRNILTFRMPIGL